MSKLTLGSYPHMLGFEQLERLVERTAKAENGGYPLLTLNKLRITLTASHWRLPVLPRKI